MSGKTYLTSLLTRRKRRAAALSPYMLVLGVCLDCGSHRYDPDYGEVCTAIAKCAVPVKLIAAALTGNAKTRVAKNRRIMRLKCRRYDRIKEALKF